jgi:hypothetical protein
VIGGDRVVKMLRAMPDKVTDQRFRALMRRTFQVTRERAYQNAMAAGLLRRPKFGYSPGIKNAIGLEKDKYAPYLRPAFNIGPTKPFFHLRLWEGAHGSPSGPHIIRPSTKRRLSFEGTNQYAGTIVTAKQVNHPGHGVRPWLRPALHETFNTVVDRMNKGMDAIVKRYFRSRGAR